MPLLVKVGLKTQPPLTLSLLAPCSDLQPFEALDTQPWRSCEIPSRELVSSRSLDDPTMTRLQHAACAACRGRPESVLPLDSSAAFSASRVPSAWRRCRVLCAVQHGEVALFWTLVRSPLESI